MGASGTAIEACIKQIVVVRDVAGEAEQPEQLSTDLALFSSLLALGSPGTAAGSRRRRPPGILESEYEAGKITHRWYK